MPARDASQADAINAQDTGHGVPVKFRFATKTALSLTLAYLIPMAMGWPQPQTAATTVMLIAATGMVSESLQKGVLRVLGTVVGAVIGLSLIALFPQDRMVYLLAVSTAVSIIIYLYSAYQGDSTLFMLAAVVTLMVFNGGDAEGAFLYGVDRAFMTVFGVLVYTVVASLLWPVKTEDNTHALAAAVASGYRAAFSRLVRPSGDQESPIDEQLASLLAAEETFQTQFAVAKNNRDALAAYLGEWNAVVSCYEDLQDILLPALKQEPVGTLDYADYIADYPRLLNHIEGMFAQIEAAWAGQDREATLQVLEVTVRPGSLREASHLDVAAVATRMEILAQIQVTLSELDVALNSLLFDNSAFRATRTPRGKPSFLWLDLESFKTALRVFTTFWVACGIWIQFNPPGGFTFVTMCTILIPLVSYTPVTPKLLFILFTLGFIFALPAYVFLLPAMTHWLELAAFLFAYAFVGFYVLSGPVSIFFLLGLFTLGIQNEMSYNFNAIIIIMLMFYMVCALLIISIHFPFTSKPEKIYAGIRRRFFRHCSRLARLGTCPEKFQPIASLRLRSGSGLLPKLRHWGAMIDNSYFHGNDPAHIKAFNHRCDLLEGQLGILQRRAREFSENPLIAATDRRTTGARLVTLCDTLAGNRDTTAFAQTREQLVGTEERLDKYLGEDYLDRYTPTQLAQFYVYLSLQASILAALDACREAQQKLDWEQLGETRF